MPGLRFSHVLSLRNLADLHHYQRFRFPIGCMVWLCNIWHLLTWCRPNWSSNQKFGNKQLTFCLWLWHTESWPPRSWCFFLSFCPIFQDWDYGTFICGDSPCDISGVAASISNLKEATTAPRQDVKNQSIPVIFQEHMKSIKNYQDVMLKIKDDKHSLSTTSKHIFFIDITWHNLCLTNLTLESCCSFLRWDQDGETISACQEGDIVPSGATCTPNCKCLERWKNRKDQWISDWFMSQFTFSVFLKSVWRMMGDA